MATIDLTIGGPLGVDWYNTGKDFNFIRTVDFSVTANNAVTSDVVQLFKIPAGTLVSEVIVVPTTKQGATCTITMGDGDDANGWLTTADLNTLPSGFFAFVSGHLINTGATPTHGDAYHPGKYYSATDTIDIVPANTLDTAVVRFIVRGVKVT